MHDQGNDKGEEIEVMRLANEDLIPFEYTNLAETIKTYVKELQTLREKRAEEIAERNRQIEDGVFKFTSDPRDPVAGPRRQPDGRLGAPHYRKKHRRRPHRLFLRDRQQHEIVVLIAGQRNDTGVGESRRNIEPQPRPGTVEKFLRADVGHSSVGLHHRPVQPAALTCSASAIAKHAPPDSIPNIMPPSIIRCPPLSTRSYYRARVTLAQISARPRSKCSGPPHPAISKRRR